MTFNTNYEYVEPTEDEIKFMEDIIEKIFPLEDERKLYMTLLCSGMIGKTLEKFINANGSGGNGKGMLNELFYLMSGEYAYNCANDVLLKPLKQGNNTDVANMGYKRIIFYREPDTTYQQKLNISTIKEITGGSEISATKKYSNNTKCVLYGTHIIECNDRPKISGKIDNATIRRLIDVPFRSTFTKDADDCCGDYIYEGDDYLKTNEFKQKYKCALFKVLMSYMTAYIQSNENIDSFICESVKKRTNEYLEGCDEVLNFFNENYQKSEEKTKELKVKDIYDNFRQSDIYLNMNKAEKRAFNYSKFTNEIKTNIFLRKYYKDRNGNIRNIILGWEQIQNEEEPDSDDELNQVL
jgi:phage/plasmid-associated DNA primase